MLMVDAVVIINIYLIYINWTFNFITMSKYDFNDKYIFGA